MDHLERCVILHLWFLAAKLVWALRGRAGARRRREVARCRRWWSVRRLRRRGLSSWLPQVPLLLELVVFASVLRDASSLSITPRSGKKP